VPTTERPECHEAETVPARSKLPAAPNCSHARCPGGDRGGSASRRPATMRKNNAERAAPPAGKNAHAHLLSMLRESVGHY